MKNLTLSIDDDLLAKARNYARKHNTTVNSMVREFLRKTTNSGNQDWIDDFFEQAGELDINSGGNVFKRYDAYDL